jgi:hypothetical protein
MLKNTNSNKFYTIANVLLIVSILVSASGCNWFRSSNVSDLEFQGVKFRTGAAHEAFLGSIGMKRTDGINRYELKFSPAWSDLAVETTTKFDRSLEYAINKSLGLKGSQGAEELDAKMMAEASISSEEKANSKGKFHIFRIVDTRALVEQLNDESNSSLREYLQRSSEYRLVTSIVVAFSYQQSETIQRNAEGGITLNTPSGIAAEASASYIRAGTEELRISDGTIFAYEFSRMCWQRSNGKVIVADILLDRDVRFSDSDDCLKDTENDPTVL